jgi:tripartite-type tricarboxylate transporter receptor subunit TctC
MFMNRFTFSGSVLSIALASATLASAQQNASDYPSRPIRIVTGYSPGGTTDLLSRIVGIHLLQSMGQQVIVDNRPGAAAQTASQIVARSTPDGYTLLMTPSGSHTVNPSLYKKLPYDTVRDFAAVAMVAWVTNVILTASSSPINSMQDLIAAAKAKPGQLTYASAGNGTLTHLSAEMLKSITGINLVHVPYKGGGQATVAIAANETNIMFGSLPSSMPFIQSKRVKALAVTSPKRASSLPDVPTVAEAGLPALAVMEWYGVLARRRRRGRSSRSSTPRSRRSSENPTFNRDSPSSALTPSSCRHATSRSRSNPTSRCGRRSWSRRARGRIRSRYAAVAC